MCGIFCSLNTTHHILPNAEIQQRLANRGPDIVRTIQTSYPSTTGQHHESSTGAIHVTLCSTVLSLRSSVPVTQPYQDSYGKYTLCWNGEAWSIDGISSSENDTKAVHQLLVDSFKAFADCGQPQIAPAPSANIVAGALSKVAGPYAFVFFDHSRGLLFFGRDFLGRRSLLWKVTEHGDLIISSVSDGKSEEGWTEIPADGVYCVDLSTMDFRTTPSGPLIRQLGRFATAVAPYQYTDGESDCSRNSRSVIPRLSLYKDIPSYSHSLNAHSQAVACLENVLQDSLRLRVTNIPEPPLLSTEDDGLHRTKLAILFSGGLDCTVLARMSHDLLPPDEHIDLLNVAFENPRIHKDVNLEDRDAAYELCPDRITGRASYEELRETCPHRQWRFVAINIPYQETMEHRQKVITLMHPHNTEMDLSISLALYFAARGIGHLDLDGAETVSHTTFARVLLSGLGADELFGGYTRHANAFRRNGLQGLLDELELDVSRLGQRNLGRDDRVMAHWSKEVRLPYLDEHLLSWALNVPVTDKCGFHEQRQDSSTTPENESEALEPEKKVLRCLAWKLGMRGVATERKRAIQFGARTAKMETRKTKGTQLLS